MNYIHEIDFKFSELAYASLQKQIDEATQNTVITNGKISLNNPGCFTCNVGRSLSWKHSIAGKEINTKFPTFYYIHIRLMNKVRLSDQYKLTDIISDHYQKNALLINVTPVPVSINFYESTNLENIIYSKILVPNIFYSIDQSIPHRYITMENSVKLFTASSSRRRQFV